MIKREDVYRIGTIGKPHGIKGEVTFSFMDDVFDRVDAEYVFLMMDGILVPFFMEEYRFRSDSGALVKFEGIDSAEQARMLTNVEVYFPKHLTPVDDTLPGWDYFIGFRVEDLHHGLLGTLSGVDESTVNVLLVVSDGDREILIPAHEDFMVSLDEENRLMTVDIPEGLLDTL